MIEFILDRGSGVSTYLRLVHQVEQALRLGTLRPGDQVPTAREGLVEAWVREARAAGLDQEDLRALFAAVPADTAKEGVA
ncbi:hypothetical protein [Nonomuraea sp. NPDC050783]|uniref:hypothetical protein n=1 Tax=Nonomuraea sp. NPDC050783 TaxID=3154634 RepID=UPI0034654422